MANQSKAVALIVVPGPQGYQTFPLEEESACSIGRGTGNTVVLDDASISRRHAIIDCTSGNECYITDVGSRNGTFRNDVRIGGRTRLRNGDRLRIGTVPLTFWMTSPPEDLTLQSVISENTQILTATSHVTVLVADIRDFTVMSRRLGDTRLSEVVGGFMQLAGQQLEKRGATAQKYIGDSVMGVWDHGPARPRPEAILPVLLTAVKLFEIAAASEGSFGEDAKINIGAGINTGLAVLGNLGSRAAADYTALGDTVNKAFRLETASKEVEHDLLIGTVTWEYLDPALQASFHSCTVALKGYDQPEPAYGMSVKSLAVALNALRKQ